jgi:DNA-binding MurR/RpiR family transcriptional regulator
MNALARITSAYDTMSKSHRKIAHYVQSHRTTFLFDSLATVSNKVGSSEATIVRFAQKLGYSGYSTFQGALRDELRQQTGAAQTDDAVAQADLGAFPGTFSDEACGRISKLYQSIDGDIFENASELLMTAESVLVIGYMDAFGVAAQAFHLIDGIRANTNFCRILFEINEIYRHIHRNAAILVYSFAPHYKFTYELLQIAREKGSRVVLVSDTPISPLVPLADYVLCAEIGREEGSVLVDVSAPAFLSYMLVRRMGEKYPAETAAFQAVTLRRYEEFLTLEA